MSRPVPPNLLDRLMAEAQADDYALADAAPATRGGLVAATGLLAVIGFLLAAAFWQQEAVQPSATDRRQVLIDRVEAAGEQTQQLQEKAAELRSSVSQLQQLASSGLGEDFTEQLRALEIASGFVGLTGPGAVLVMDDADPPLPPGVEPDEAKVLDMDLQLAVNGLWESGAQAVAINDVRLTSVTAIRTAGEAILVDYRPLEPPYRITAVGPSDLGEVFEGSETAKELKGLGRDYGIQSEVRSAREVTVPASTANLPVRAEVVKGASP